MFPMEFRDRSWQDIGARQRHAAYGDGKLTLTNRFRQFHFRLCKFGKRKLCCIGEVLSSTRRDTAILGTAEKFATSLLFELRYRTMNCGLRNPETARGNRKVFAF